MRLTTKLIAKFIIGIIFLISSFDVFLNVKLFGFSLRFIFIFILLLIFIYVLHQYRSKFKLKIHFLSGTPFFIWILFLIAFIPNTTLISRNIGYVVWLILLSLFILILPHFIKGEVAFLRMIKWYIHTFFLIAIFGLIQFVLGLGGISLLTAQFWDNSNAPRINGFSYEPSYFSTYMLICWVTCFFILIHKNNLQNYLNIRSTFVIITVVLILSTSRMGILFILLIVTGYALKNLIPLLFRFKIRKRAMIILLPFTITIFSAISYSVFNFKKVYFLFNGLGIFGTASHSSGTRWRELIDTLKAFYNSPFIGYSLGGIPSAVAEVRGYKITTQLEAKAAEGMNIFAEVLAASGFLGFLFFAFFLFSFFYKVYGITYQLRNINRNLSILIFALLMGLLFELLILNMNQNILRPYLWIHFAVVNLGYFTAKDMLTKHRLNNSVENNLH
jgi:hypothetical protein